MQNGSFLLLYLAFFNFACNFDQQDEPVMDQNHHTVTAEWTQVF